MKKILYVGSGNSAKLVDAVPLDDYTVCCVNNAWRLFKNYPVNAWIRSGDFPTEQKPKPGEFKFETEVGYHEYAKTAEDAKNYFNWDIKSPQHHCGYTIFFMGLYWIMMSLRPEKICLLGFDHDYNPAKVEKWNQAKRPNLQNQFCNKTESSIQEWGENFFKNLEADSFYGSYSTPDPLRLGATRLKDKFKLALESCEKLNIDLVNFSPVESEINIARKEPINSLAPY